MQPLLQLPNQIHNNMSTKNLFAILLIFISGLILWSFVLPFKELAVDNVSAQLTGLQSAYENATQQLSLKTLQNKKMLLNEQQISLLENFIPQQLHSGSFVYNLGQLANQNRLTVKGLQYTVMDDTLQNPNGEKKLQVEFTMDGSYEDFTKWLGIIEKSNVLIDVNSVRAVKSSNSSSVITFYVKMFAYGINID